jgi:hypothetical protein
MKGFGFLNHMVNEELGEVDGKTIYALRKALWYVAHTGITIIIQEGFQHDLASVPRIPIVYEAWGNRSHREAVLHDYLYRSDSAPVVERAEADEHFKMAMISRKQPWRVYHPMWLGVRLCGKWSYHKRTVNYCFISCGSY